jgi:uncharacterized protein
MRSRKPSRVVIDTNLWISFLIGKEFQGLKDLIVQGKIKLIITDQLITEIRTVTLREKFKKYFNENKVVELIELLTAISENVKIKKIEAICRDSKDDFLLALSKASKANYLITGDKDLLTIKTFGNTEILTFSKFKHEIR